MDNQYIYDLLDDLSARIADTKKLVKQMDRPSHTVITDDKDRQILVSTWLGDYTEVSMRNSSDDTWCRIENLSNWSVTPENAKR